VINISFAQLSTAAAAGRRARRLNDEPRKHASLLLGQQKAAELPLALNLVEHCHLLRATQAENRAREKVVLNREADAEARGPRAGEQPVREEELLRRIAHVGELEVARLYQPAQE